MKNPGTFKVGNKVKLLPVTRKVAIVGTITALTSTLVTIQPTGTTGTANQFTAAWALITSMTVTT